MNNTIYVKRIKPHRWELTRKWEAPNGVVVPANFYTDGATIPRFLWIFATPAGVMFEAALLHDYRYVSQTLSRKEADNEFYEMLIHCKVNKYLAKGAWAAVRMFGKSYYDKLATYKLQKGK